MIFRNASDYENSTPGVAVDDCLNLKEKKRNLEFVLSFKTRENGIIRRVRFQKHFKSFGRKVS